jgi:hypothetical protein
MFAISSSDDDVVFWGDSSIDSCAVIDDIAPKVMKRRGWLSPLVLLNNSFIETRDGFLSRGTYDEDPNPEPEPKFESETLDMIDPLTA